MSEETQSINAEDVSELIRHACELAEANDGNVEMSIRMLLMAASCMMHTANVPDHIAISLFRTGHEMTRGINDHMENLNG